MPDPTDAQIIAACDACVFVQHSGTGVSDLTCHRNPPVVLADGPSFPSVLVDDWCGEFLPATPPEQTTFVVTPNDAVLGGIAVSVEVRHADPANVERPNPSRP
jgi:hypothetical protein